jgi:O-antigen/teichoic acid export membrane protein
LLCLIFPLVSLSPILAPAVFAIGKPMANLISMLIMVTFMPLAFLIGIRFGLVGLCLSWVLSYPIVFLVTISIRLKVLNLSLKQFLNEIYFQFVTSLLLLAALLLLRKLLISSLQPVALLIGFILFGVVFYCSSVLMFRRDEIFRLRSFLQR